MVVTWSADKDQYLFVAVITKCGLKLGKEEYQSIIDNWPKSLGEKPTQRAIVEHISKIKSQVNAATGGSTAPKTPKSGTNKAAAISGKATASGSGGKKRRRVEDSDDDSDDTPVHPTMKKEADDAIFGDGVKTRPGRKAKGGVSAFMQKVLGEFPESGGESSDGGMEVDEYHPRA